jgi:hypothetical protein
MDIEISEYIAFQCQVPESVKAHIHLAECTQQFCMSVFREREYRKGKPDNHKP